MDNENQSSQLFKLDLKDVGKSVIMAAIAGFLLPISVALTTPGFDIFTANWLQLFSIAENGAIVGAIGYLVKNFFSTPDGKFMGSIG